MAEHRTLRLRLATGELRTAIFDSREHYVVPVTMLVEGVIHAVNAPAPELVLAEEFAEAPLGWNGRPVVVDHPQDGGRQVSANSPRILEEYAFGVVFNTTAVDTQLQAEAWIDPSKVKPGRASERMLERVKKQEPIEISVGVFVDPEKRSGKHNGKEYKAIWRNIVPDHLAFLSEGQVGACSNEMGCGIRAAQAYVPTPDGFKTEEEMNEKDKPSLRERLASLLRLRNNAMSDQELRDMLNVALRADEPGYLGIDAVFPSESSVIYAVQPEQELTLFRRKYKLSGTDLTLGEKEEVKPEMQYVPVTAASAASCPCGGHKEPPTVASTHEGEEHMKPKTERVKALIESKKTPFGEADRQYLETLSDERLNELETFANTLAAETDKSTEQKPTTQPPVEQPKEEAPQEATPVTAEAYIAAAPAPVREFLQAGIRAANTAKESAIAQLRASGRCDFSEDELRVKSYDELQRLAKLAGTGQPVPQAPVDFSGQPLPRAAAGGNDKIPDPPPSLTDKIRSLRTRVQ